VDRFRALATPLADMVRPMPYPELYGPAQEGYHPVAASRTAFADRVDRGAAEAIVDGIETSSAQRAVAQLRVLGGAVARVPQGATAFAHRRSRIMALVVAIHERPDDRPEHEAWVAGLAAELGGGDAGAYVGFLADEGEDGVRAAYPRPTRDRLAAIKARYDPDNVFRLNHNVPPAAAPASRAA
jgi:hypothetical protein